MTEQQRLLRDVCMTYARAYTRMEEAAARGLEERRDECFAQVQEIENSVTVTEHSRAWRNPRGAKPGAFYERKRRHGR